MSQHVLTRVRRVSCDEERIQASRVEIRAENMSFGNGKVNLTMKIQEGLSLVTGSNQASSLVNRVSARALVGVKKQKKINIELRF